MDKTSGLFPKLDYNIFRVCSAAITCCCNISSNTHTHTNTTHTTHTNIYTITISSDVKGSWDLPIWSFHTRCLNNTALNSLWHLLGCRVGLKCGLLDMTVYFPCIKMSILKATSLTAQGKLPLSTDLYLWVCGGMFSSGEPLALNVKLILGCSAVVRRWHWMLSWSLDVQQWWGVGGEC